MSKGVEIDRALAEIREWITDRQQQIFEDNGGTGPVIDFIEQGATNEGFEAMTGEKKELYLTIASLSLLAMHRSNEIPLD